ncbi:MAG: hypothetical protein ABIF22_02765 [bacterium]
MNKKGKILDIVLDQITKQKESLNNSIKRCEVEIDEASSPMVSHSDTTRYQVSQQVSNLSNYLVKLEQAEKIMRESSAINDSRILSVGSTAELDVDGKSMFIFIVPDGVGGLTVDGDIKISIVSERFPMAISIIGKKVGDLSSFKINGKEKKIKILNS